MPDWKRTPIGGTHARDWDILPTQRPRSDLPAGPDGFVRFDCSKCGRREKIALASLHERFSEDWGLVNILNAVTPNDCRLSKRDASGIRACGFRYVGLR